MPRSSSESQRITPSANNLAEGITFNGDYNCKVFSVFSAVLHVELEAQRFENRRLDGDVLKFADGLF
jgi:hypothetical protein